MADLNINEVIKDGEVLLSTRGTTVAPENLASGETAIDSEGNLIVGEMENIDISDVYRVPDNEGTLSSNDYIPFNDVSDEDDKTKKVKYSTLKSDILGNAYQTSDSASSDLADGDYIPFNDVSDSNAPKKKTLLSDLANYVRDKVSNIFFRIAGGTEIPSNADLNTYTTIGNYLIKTDAIAGTISNMPIHKKAGRLYVMQGTNYADTYKVQLYYSAYLGGTAGIFMRYTANNSSWSNWMANYQNVSNNTLHTFNYINANRWSQLKFNHSDKHLRLNFSTDGGSTWNGDIEVIDKVNLADHTHVLDGGLYLDSSHAIKYTDDLNNFTSSGTYQYTYDSNGMPANAPNWGDIRSFKLIVDRYSSDTRSEIMQKITMIKDQGEWYRVREWNVSTWGAWKQFATTDDISPSSMGNGYAEGTVSGSAITATISGFQLRAGVIVVLKLLSAMPSNATLNINSTGAKTITWDGNNAIRGGDDVTNTGNVIYTFMYDGTYYRVLSFNLTPSLYAQNYNAGTSGNIVLQAGVNADKFEIKHNIGEGHLKYNYYKSGSWRGDVTVADYYDIIQQTFGTNIPSNSDLNDYKTNGIYNVSTNSSASTISNMPCEQAGKLVVQKVSGNQYIKQTFFTYDSAFTYQGFYERSYNGDSGGGWRPWRKFIESQDNIICNSTNPLADLYTNKINGQDVINASNGIITNKNITTAVTSLDDIALNTAGTIVLDASISPTRGQLTFLYIYYGNSRAKTIEVTRYNHSNKNTEEFWKNSWGDTTGWTGWMPLSRQGTYIGTCNTEASQRAKVATVDDDFSLKKGVRVGIKFTYTNSYSNATANPITLNVNNTGAKNIWYNNTHSGAGNTGTNATAYGTAGRYHFYVYDGTYWVWTGHGDDSNSTNFLRNDASSTLTASSAWLALKASNVDVTQADNGVSSTVYPALIIQDKNGRTTTRLETVVNVNGNISSYWYVANYKTATSSSFAGGIKITATKSGDLWYVVDSARNYLRALGCGYNQCDTAESTTAKVVDMSYYILQENGYVTIKFTYAVPANATLNINNQGAKDIYYRGSPITAGVIKAGDVAFFYYHDNKYNLLCVDSNGTNFLRNDASSTLTASSPYLSIKASNIDMKQSNNNVSSTQYPALIIQDKNGLDMTRVETVVEANGTIRTYFQTCNYNTGTSSHFRKGITFYTNKSGDMWYGFQHKKNFLAELGCGYATCDTAESTTAKVVTFSRFGLTSGGYVTIKFTYAVPANATLNINNQGAKNIYYHGSAITAGRIRAGDYATFVYDGTQFNLIGIDRDSERIFTATLSANATTVTFTGLPTSGNHMYDIYTDKPNLTYTNINNSTSGQITVTFPAQTTATNVYLKVSDL